MTKDFIQEVKYIIAATIIGLVMIFAATPALAINIQPMNSNNSVTGVETSSTTALDVNNATNMAGESAFFNRLMTLLFNCNPLATTTDALIVTGEANLAWYWISGQNASSSVSFYDGLQVTGAPKIAEWGIAINNSATSSSMMPQRLVGAHFNDGIYADVTLASNQVLNVCTL